LEWLKKTIPRGERLDGKSKNNDLKGEKIETERELGI